MNPLLCDGNWHIPIMNGIAFSCQRLVALSPLVAASLVLAGCGREGGTSAGTPPQASASRRAPARYPKLQAELDDLLQVPLEHDPTKRPLILSEREGNRRDWALRALERGYAQGGGTNKLWDSQMHAACRAYVDYTRGGAADRQYAALTNAVLAAAAVGCRDPMLQYMQVRYGLVDTTASPDQYALTSLHAFRAMLGSHHHPVFKFIAGYRVVEASRAPDIKSNPGGATDLVTAALEDLARDTNAPPEEVFEAAFLWLEFTRAKGWVDYVCRNLQGIMHRHWGHHEAYFRWLGLAEYKRAWDERGTGFANTVKEAGFERFGQHLKLAQAALEASWQMNPSNAYTAYLMMQVELGQGQGRTRMQQWFDRAITLATNYYDAAKLMSFYLEPRWYGSEDEALEFARSCVTSTNVGGRVPLVLPDVHHSLAAYQKLKDSPEYWHRSEVWDDVRSAYDRFFALNPDASAYRHDYALDAYLCGHYAEFLAQAKLFSWTNFQYFGGEDKFRQMLVRAAAAKPDAALK
jgi:hypothetical protein